MNYKFPIINSIDEIREAIADKEEFQELKRGDFTVFQYNVIGPDTFPAMNVAGGNESMRIARLRKYALLRECRGLIFGPDGKVLSRRFHKFFNINERPETSMQMVSDKLNKMPHVVLEKLDGSMVTPIALQDGKYIRWATKRGIGTDVANEVELFALKHPQYNQFASYMHIAGFTPIFEFIAPNNRIVVNYNEGKLVLLAIRDNINGKYSSYEYTHDIAGDYNIPHVGIFYSPISSTVQKLEALKDHKGIEGVVVLFDDGHMVKVKTDWYVEIHKAKDGLRFEKDMLALVLNNKIDDLLPHLLEDDATRVKKYQQSVLHDGMLLNKHKAIDYHCKLKENGIDRKEFATKWADKLNGFQKYIIFKSWDYWATDPTKLQGDIITYMLNHCTSQSNIDKLHGEMNFEKW